MAKRLLLIIIAVFIFILALIAVEEVMAVESYGPYKAKVVEIVEGDIVIVDVYLWTDLVKRVKLSLTDVYTPQSNSHTLCEKEAARIIRSFVKHWLKGSGNVTVVDVRPNLQSYEVKGYLYKGEDSLSDVLVEKGYGRYYANNNREGWCVDKP